mmetsp:Transcript_8999/g.19912  ORF Transcript_8999/g.19912 Transcript_8999/m.19912 type:complete len:175 (+) Transcript_8999:528-1052(+)
MDHFSPLCTFWDPRLCGKKIEIFGKDRNVKGQKYTIDSSGNKVTNYSEILGKAVHVRAEGTFVQSESRHGENDEPVVSANKSAQVVNSASSFPSFLTNIASKFSRERTDLAVTCPVDYTVSVTGASVNFFWIFIKNSDRRDRIFTSSLRRFSSAYIHVSKTNRSKYWKTWGLGD